ncbi:MAG: dTMP kinase [Elusimicrobiales bacterium]|nr:dTMP kinase [Elusimicrobiales bacterium]
MKKGFFIVLEGPDRSGKSTQAAMLKEWLEQQGMQIILTREPGGTAISERIRKILLDPQVKAVPVAELFLFAVSRSQHTAEIIKPALAAGKIVISDRFTMSTEAYQGYGRGLPAGVIRTVNRIATEGIKPDLTVVFDVPEQEFEKRIREVEEKNGPDRFEREDIEFRRRIQKAYRTFSRRKGIKRIDASKSIDEIQSELRVLVWETIKDDIR